MPFGKVERPRFSAGRAVKPAEGVTSFPRPSLPWASTRLVHASRLFRGSLDSSRESFGPFRWPGDNAVKFLRRRAPRKSFPANLPALRTPPVTRNFEIHRFLDVARGRKPFPRKQRCARWTIDEKFTADRADDKGKLRTNESSVDRSGSVLQHSVRLSWASLLSRSFSLDGRLNQPGLSTYEAINFQEWN